MYIEEIELNETGKKVLIIAGTHGNESNAVNLLSLYGYYLKRLKYFLDKKQPGDNYFIDEILYPMFKQEKNIKSITIVNALNETGLKYNTREFIQLSSTETDDLNRYFDDERIPNKDDIMERLDQLIKKHDIIIDVHNTENVTGCVSIALNVNAPYYTDFCLKNKIPFILMENNNTIKKHADLGGKKAFTVEVTYLGYNLTSINEDLRCKELALLISRICECAKDENKTFNKYSLDDLIPYKSVQLTVYKEGLLKWKGTYPMDDGRLDLTPSLKEEGETLASILDPLTRNEVGKIIAPRKGYLMSISGSYWSAGTVGDYQPRLPDSIMEMYHD